MSQTFALTRRMQPRDRDEEHRVSTPLELLVDLTFVVAVAQASASLHHALAAGHVGTALGAYPVVLFGVWWAWMNFTWFASAYDTDDAIYRVATLVQMAGVLVLAAGVPRVHAPRFRGRRRLPDQAARAGVRVAACVAPRRECGDGAAVRGGRG